MNAEVVVTDAGPDGGPFYVQGFPAPDLVRALLKHHGGRYDRVLEAWVVPANRRAHVIQDLDLLGLPWRHDALLRARRDRTSTDDGVGSHGDA
jgi:hypothetical protein